jgi:hypothetical protein
VLSVLWCSLKYLSFADQNQTTQFFKCGSKFVGLKFLETCLKQKFVLCLFYHVLFCLVIIFCRSNGRISIQNFPPKISWKQKSIHSKIYTTVFYRYKWQQFDPHNWDLEGARTTWCQNRPLNQIRRSNGPDNGGEKKNLVLVIVWFYFWSS